MVVRVEVLVQQQAGPADGEDGLDELHLADLRHRADREAAVPGEEAEEHADDAEVGEGGPLRRRRRRRLLDGGHDGQEDHQRRADDERPRHRLPRTELAGEQPALRVADGRGDDRAEQQQVGPAQLSEAAPLRRGEADRGQRADRRDDPEDQRRPLVAAHGGHRRRRGRQQPDDDRAVAGGRGGERVGGEHREADDDAAADDGQAQPLAAAREPLVRHGEGDGGEDARRRRRVPTR